MWCVCVCVCSYVKVGSLVSEWQRLGVEAPHNTSLEELLSEVMYHHMHHLACPCPSTSHVEVQFTITRIRTLLLVHWCIYMCTV